MANRFLNFYNEELSALRNRATRFADAYPKIAGRLRLARDTSDDPHVERLAQSFAFSAARIRQKLDDSLPELADGLIETLYPHYLAPVPSMTIVNFTPSRDMEKVHKIARGTGIVTKTPSGKDVNFVTTQDVELAPLRIDTVRLMAPPIEAPLRPDLSGAGVLRISLSPRGEQPIHQMGLGNLRLYISAPQSQALDLYRLLHQHCIGVSFASHSADPSAQHMGPSIIQPAGFTDQEALFPYPDNSFEGYRTLTEFFTLPEKFLFFDIDTRSFNGTDRQDIYIYFNTSPDALEKKIDNTSLTLFATPIVNLFSAWAEPIHVNGTQSRYSLIANARNDQARKVYSIKSVTLAAGDGSIREAKPYFHRYAERRTEGIYWQLLRHEPGDGTPSGSTSLAFVDTRNQAMAPGDESASIEILATNGDLPRQLPFGGGQPHLRTNSINEHVAHITCLLPPTPPRRSAPPSDRAWELISHLSLNHLSLTHGGTSVLRNILKLYDPGDSRETAQKISAISSLQTKPGLARIGQVMVPGSDIEITFDHERIDPAQAIFFGTMLDRFLGCYTALNSYTRLTLKLSGRSDILAQFPARAGEEALI